MDISKAEQRVLHLLAQGGYILVEKDETGRIINQETVTRDGWYWAGCSQQLFQKLKYKRLISSKNSGPYRITQLGLRRVRSQLDSR
ncbi:MAG: YjhX family toxin [Roseibium sp.]|uniref:YjhX family toxin n=1 Tax=Roseibium sp. TaxID=1936156 RepID=UPI001B1A7480|nr:YjhX family toxin [Roseibium sp.]MBO6892306.1 YjhX family toxin [Roseibium sp.]